MNCQVGDRGESKEEKEEEKVEEKRKKRKVEGKVEKKNMYEMLSVVSVVYREKAE